MSTREKSRLRVVPPLSVIVLIVLLALPSIANGAEANPRWHISLRSFPTTLVRGSAPEGTSSINAVPQYSAIITNVGAGEAAGPITITEALPQGITIPGSFHAQVAPFEDCETPSPHEVVCHVLRSVASGEELVLSVPLEVAESAPTPAVTQVEVTGGGAPPAADSLATTVGGPPPGFGLLEGAHGLFGTAIAESGLDTDLAGSHPYSVLLEANFTTLKTLAFPHPVQDLRDLELRLPHGLAVNPEAATELCTEAELGSQSDREHGVGGCGRASQIGLITIETLEAGILPVRLPLYDMQAPPGVAAEFGFNVLHTLVHVQGGLDGAFHLTGGSSEILAKYPVLGLKVELWGNPADSHHDAVRRANNGCGIATHGCSLSPEEANKVPFITMPSSCHEPLVLGAAAFSWEGATANRQTFFSTVGGGPLEAVGCNALGFEPTLRSQATTTAAESPSGLDFAIHQPQNEALEGRATAALRNALVSLPEGMTVNSAAANGLDSCTETQMGYAPDGPKVQFSTIPQSCPAAAKVGTLEVKTPLLRHKLPGSVYVAKPFANPFGSLLAIYLAIEDEESGIIAKLAGKVQPDHQTGRLAATFLENPELPVEDIELHFFEGEHGTLTTPLVCGAQTTISTLTPWSTPEGAAVHPEDSFQTSVDCRSSEAAAPKTTSFTAGTVSPLAGAYSPFVLRLSRPDGSQHFTGIETTLPPGLVGKLAGIAYCPDAAITQARNREEPEAGRLEQENPSCPSSSEVGTVNVTAGSGPSPLPVAGHAYLAGPYKGAPLSMVVIVPAVAGPFDLGTVVDRVALNVGEYDARIRAVADPLPTIRDGIPLDVRSIELKLNHPNFTLNPTSCDVMAIEGQASTRAGQSAPLKNRFQVGECSRLAFKPSLKISLTGATKRTGHPALKAVVTYPKQGAYANIARAQVSLPHSEFLDQGNIGKACTKVQLAARACPASSVYGKVKAWTPLLDQPLEGPVYLAGGYGYKLPALVAELNGQIRVLLVGKVDTDSQKGIRNTFEAAPDAPVEKFVLEMKGGKRYGLLENSENICKKQQKAGAAFTAQNGRIRTYSVKIANSCKHKHSKKQSQ